MRTVAIQLAILAQVMLVGTSGKVAADASKIVNTQFGKIAGISLDNGVSAYLGIPYAAPPVGELRWREAQKPKPWDGIKAADRFGPTCIQNHSPENGPWGDDFQSQTPYSEDCLSVNVWTPKVGETIKLPVVFWIYGGGLIQGGSSTPVYNGANFAKRGVVFVSINYRVGIPGFFAHPELTKESTHQVSGNYGLEDQIRGLEWLRDNIQAFGGDPTKVTIVGQSAGARSVYALLYSPLAHGLFRGAIAESGIPWVLPLDHQDIEPLKVKEQDGVDYATAKGASTLEQLRTLPSSALAVPNGGVLRPKFVPGVSFQVGLIADGYSITRPMSEQVDSKPINDVPLIIGHNKDEGDIRIPLTQSVALTQFADHIAKVYGGQKDNVLAAYPITGNDASKAQLALGHDRVLFGIEDWAVRRSAQASAPIYVYNFGHVMPGYTAKPWGAFHTSEVPYWTMNLKALGRPTDADDDKVSATISNYWLNFIVTGNPNGDGVPLWRRASKTNEKIMEIDVKSHMRPITEDKRIASIFEKYYATHQ